MNQWLALALTLACEVPVLLALARARSWRIVLPAALLASCLTHPLAWQIALRLSPDEYLPGIWIIEAAVVGAEAAWYALVLRPGWRRALLWSALANAASFGLGLLIWS